MKEYICTVEHLLNNPVYNALLTGDAALSLGSNTVKFFDPKVSPFAGFDENNANGFDELHSLLPAGRRILYAVPQEIQVPKGWKLSAYLAGLQFILYKDKYAGEKEYATEPVPLSPENAEEMISLAALTKPGPFNKRTIEFGSYYGIFQNGKLAAMTGQRLHVADFSEISAVCTHPDHLGKGFAGILLRHQVGIILRSGKTPFLHVRADNRRAIELYERLGFKVSRNMHFYFLKRE